MTADPLAEVLDTHTPSLARCGQSCDCLLIDGCDGCEWVPETVYNDTATAAFHRHVADAVRAFLAEHVAKPEVVEAVASVIDSRTGSHMGVAHWHLTTRAALAALLATLGGESNE